MKETLKIIGGFALWIAFAIFGILVAIFFINGGIWLSEKLLPILSVVSTYTLLICISILVPLSIFQPTRIVSGGGLAIASYVFGASLWMSSLLLTYELWGVTGVLIGLVFAGVGVVPIALLATAFKGMWPIFFELLLAIVATFGSRLLGYYVLEKYESRKYQD